VWFTQFFLYNITVYFTFFYVFFWIFFLFQRTVTRGADTVSIPVTIPLILRHERCTISSDTGTGTPPWIDTTSQEVRIQYRYHYQSLNRSIRHKRCGYSIDTSTTSPWIDSTSQEVLIQYQYQYQYHRYYVTRGALPVPIPVPVPELIDTSQEVPPSIVRHKRCATSIDTSTWQNGY
jgi:hypothetical protein